MPIRTSTLPSREVGEHLLDLASARRKRETISTRTGKSRKRSRNVFQCCSARIVVGASISTCLPLTATANAARTATSVLPKPTSPQTSRSIGRGASRSSLTASIACSWSGVSRYGNDASSCCEPLVREVVRDALVRLALRVERDQLAGELVHRLARARLEQLPRLAAELRERGRRRVGADVARHLAELLVRDVEAVVAAEREQEVVARDAGDLLRLEAEQLADAVVLVHDVVAGAQVGERLQRAAAEAPLARRAAAEDLVVGQQDEAELAPDEAAPRGRDREAERRPRPAASSPGSSSVASTRRSMFCVRSASPRCGNATTTRWPARTNAASSFSASARPRAAIAGRCASNANGWPAGTGRARVDAVERRPARGRPPPRRARTSSGWQTKSGARSSGGTRSSGTGRDLALLAVPLLDEVEAPLGGRDRSCTPRPGAARAA